jgi:predicted metalloprotease
VSLPAAGLVRTILVCVALLCAGCTSAIDGTPQGRPSVPTPTSTAAPATALDCSRTTPSAVVDCLGSSLSAYWTHVLGRSIRMRTVVDPEPAQVPQACRAALGLATAFSCPVDDGVYLTAAFVREMQNNGVPDQAWVRIATTMGHEMGHIVQFTVHEPLVEKRHSTPAESRQIEQQADCLSGVWSAAAGIDDMSFLRANAVVLGIVDTPQERASHGTPGTRLGAVQRGQQGGSAASCGLDVKA